MYIYEQKTILYSMCKVCKSTLKTINDKYQQYMAPTTSGWGIRKNITNTISVSNELSLFRKRGSSLVFSRTRTRLQGSQVR